MTASRPLLPRVRDRRLGSGELRVAAFGSSTTEGIGASDPARGFPQVMRHRMLPSFSGGIVLFNHGIGGNNAIDMDARLDAVLADSPDLVVWQTGSNDPLQEVPLERFEFLTREGLARFGAGGPDGTPDLVLVDPQYCRMLEECAAFPPFLDAVHRLGEEGGVPVFDRYRRMLQWSLRPGSGRDVLSPDGLHMGDEGYRLLGEALGDWLLLRA
ncbi:SGNH/GDSL hydrolase family protein [Rhizosaccharibacter radicis]|uniref:SGNH/GDSL hydrolase family protein n=1 Tax=Rhizosaccharibacter radicis TaxID=2782605 RepID=A0ABT1W363_9PROT|nr:SGNH/GDSL hydrolase family protein [Acetobacteraceae bacterium KSS12]